MKPGTRNAAVPSEVGLPGRSRRFRWPAASAMIVLLSLPLVARAAESWADGSLPVQNGLEFWFDAGRQAGARRAMRLPAAAPGGGADFLFDGSGRGRHLLQPLPAARPRLVEEAGTAFLRFDGKDDALTSGLALAETAELSVFVVAAPVANAGGFSAFFSLARAGANDYQSGLNLDFGPQATRQMSFLNAEGAGANGATQLLRRPPLPFGAWHVFALESQPGSQGLRLSIDGRAEGSRDRAGSVLGLHQLTLGARSYSLSAEPPHAQGYFTGAIAEFILFNRVLNPEEKSAVDSYLARKHAGLLARSPEALAQSLEPSVIEIPGEPRPRRRSEVEAILKAGEGAARLPADPEPFEIVLCAGPKDHGEGEHDYPLWQTRWKSLLAASRNVKVSAAWEWPSDEQWKTARVVVFYSNNPGWNASRAKVLDAFLARGGGLLYIHYAVDGHGDVEALADCIGYAWRGGVSKFRHGPLELKFAQSPLTTGFDTARFIDESYWNLVGRGHGVNVVATGIEEGKPQPLIWTRSQGPGRVCVNILGHYTWTFDDPLFRVLLLRGICWAGNQPVDRLSHLALQGSRLLD